MSSLDWFLKVEDEGNEHISYSGRPFYEDLAAPFDWVL